MSNPPTNPVAAARRGFLRQLFFFFAPAPPAPPIADAALIDRVYRKKRLAIMVALTGGYSLAYTCRLALSVVKKPVIDAGLLTAEELGIIGSALFYGYALGKLVNGVLSDHVHLKRFLPTGLLLSALVNLLMSGKIHLIGWTVLWGLNGWFQGFLAPASVVALSAWFSNRERGRYYGLWSTAHSFGEGLTFVMSAALVAALGWQGGFFGPGLICIAGALAMYLALEDRPESLGLPNVADWRNDHAAADVSHKESSTLRVQLHALRLPAVWMIGLASAAIYVTRYAINSWGILYLQEAKGYSLVEAGSLLGVGTVAGVAGCIAFGFLSDKLFQARRPPVNFLFGLLEIGALIAFFWLPPGTPFLTGLALVVYSFGLAGLITSLGGLFAVDLAPKRSAGAVMGVVGIFSYIAAALQERVSGWLIQRGTTMIDGVRHYDFGPAVLLWVGASVVSLLVAASLWRARSVD